MQLPCPQALHPSYLMAKCGSRPASSCGGGGGNITAHTSSSTHCPSCTPASSASVMPCGSSCSKSSSSTNATLWGGRPHVAGGALALICKRANATLWGTRQHVAGGALAAWRAGRLDLPEGLPAPHGKARGQGECSSTAIGKQASRSRTVGSQHLFPCRGPINKAASPTFTPTCAPAAGGPPLCHGCPGTAPPHQQCPAPATLVPGCPAAPLLPLLHPALPRLRAGRAPR